MKWLKLRDADECKQIIKKNGNKDKQIIYFGISRQFVCLLTSSYSFVGDYICLSFVFGAFHPIYNIEPSTRQRKGIGTNLITE